MPIKSIRLINFKCFEDSQEIPLAPLTLVFGRNNTGKSSILQSLLLLRQTFDLPIYGYRLNLGGLLYPAGSFSDIVHQHQTKRHIEIRLLLGLPGRVSLSHVDLEFCSDEPQPPRLTRFEVRSSHVDTFMVKRARGYSGPYELTIGNENLGGEKQANFRFSPNQFFPLISEEPSRVGRPSKKREASRAVARAAIAELEREIRSLRAVGAFRKQPDRRYEFRGKVPSEIDSIGEHVVNALIEDTTRRGKKGQLFRSVNRYLKKLGRVRLMPLKRISRSARLFEVRIKDIDSGRWANFADVGFGIGQAFPIIVEGLRTADDAIFLAQEPEIHLHPDAQLAMADFLIELTKNGKRLIVETHSEHLLLRVRHRIVESATNSRTKGRLSPNMVSIIHVDKGPDGTSETKRLDMDQLGQIENWPREFMEEASEERMAILGSMAKQAESK